MQLAVSRIPVFRGTRSGAGPGGRMLAQAPAAPQVRHDEPDLAGQPGQRLSQVGVIPVRAPVDDQQGTVRGARRLARQQLRPRSSAARTSVSVSTLIPYHGHRPG